MATQTTSTRGKKKQLHEPKIPGAAGRGGGGRAGVAIAVPPPPLIVQVTPMRDLSSFGPQHRFPNGQQRGLGWLRDLPDARDATIAAPPSVSASRSEEAIGQHVEALRGVAKRVEAPALLPSAVNNSEFCSPIEDQEQLGSCTAQACVGLVEYMERRASGRHIEGSRLFLYKTTRKLMGWEGDTGAFLRSTMKALVLFGLPPEEWWPHDIDTFENEPDPFLYAYALNCKAIQYVRLDPADKTPTEVLQNVRAAVDAGFAVMFGFSVYSSLDNHGDIPFPYATDRLRGGHAVLCVGYDDNRECRGAATNNGALLIRNSWGTGWGEQGYGWLPYDYVTRGLANDFWTCHQVAWIDSHHFE